MELRRVRMTVAYLGSAFHGFAINDGVRTVNGVLTDAVSKVVRRPVEIVGAGRTDAGVHGWGQVVSFDAPADTDLQRLMSRINSICGPELAVRSAGWVADDFSARFSAEWRHYRYTILTGPTPDPFRAATAWHVREPLDLDVMRLACDPLIGEHDFSSFCRRPKQRADDVPKSMVRRVLLARWSEPSAQTLLFEIRATAFCHQMVRSIVGTLVDVGRGRRSAGTIAATLRAQDRAAAGPVAPPDGLCLWDVGYPE